MQIQNTTLNINTQFHNMGERKTQPVSFKNEVSSNSEAQTKIENQDLTYQDIKKMSAEEINKHYTDKNENMLLNTLKLSTVFSGNSSMNEALFNMVSSANSAQSAQLYLHNMMSNAKNYLSHKGDKQGAWLRISIIEQIEDPKLRLQQLQEEKEFQHTMIQIDVAEHMHDMMDFSKKQRDKEDEEDDKGLFSLFDSTYFQYQALFNEYEALEYKNRTLLNQQLSGNTLYI